MHFSILSDLKKTTAVVESLSTTSTRSSVTEITSLLQDLHICSMHLLKGIYHHLNVSHLLICIENIEYSFVNNPKNTWKSVVSSGAQTHMSWSLGKCCWSDLSVILWSIVVCNRVCLTFRGEARSWCGSFETITWVNMQNQFRWY